MATPAFAWRMTCTSGQRASTASVPSVEPSSTTISSIGR